MSKLVVAPETLLGLRVALQSTVSRAQAEHRDVLIATRRTLDTVDAAVAARGAKVQQCREALDACLRSERSDCSRHVAAVADATRRLDAALSARDLARQAVADYEARAAATLRRLEKTQSLGLRYLAVKLEKVSAVNAGGPRRTGGVTSGSGTPALGLGAPAIYGLPGLPAGCLMVPVELIDQVENPIAGPQDFGKGYSIEDLDYAFDLFEARILPDLARGVDPTTFAAIDQANGVYGTRSLADTFRGFLGGDAIRLEPRPDGTYSITNGRHRVYVAARSGRSHVAAFISRRTA